MVNMAMVMMAASAFHAGYSDVAEIETAYYMLTPLLGGAAAGFFLLSLIASGISSSVVGTMAGQMIMQGFINIRLPVWFRRLVTIIPAFGVVAMGVNPTDALVMSQVVLSIALPVPMIALIIFSGRADIMGGVLHSWWDAGPGHFGGDHCAWSKLCVVGRSVWYGYSGALSSTPCSIIAAPQR